jgi:hypothetical protein
VLSADIASVGGQATRKSAGQMLVQPFVDLNLPHGWYWKVAPTPEKGRN